MRSRLHIIRLPHGHCFSNAQPGQSILQNHRIICHKRYNSSQSDPEVEELPARTPFPFLWPSLPSVTEVCPYSLQPIVTHNQRSLWDRMYAKLTILPTTYPGVNRALNIGWMMRLLGRGTFPETFLAGSLVGFEEFLRRLQTGENVDDLLTPEFAKFLAKYSSSAGAIDVLESKASITCPSSGGGIKVRDVWIFYGKSSFFAGSINKFGGILDSKQSANDKSYDLLQLPFSSFMQEKHLDMSFAMEAEPGLQVAVDVEIRGLFKFGFQGEESTEERTTVVRYVSQAFGPQRCNSKEDRARRVTHIQENIRWSIADIDYVWSKDNFYDGKRE